MEVHQPLTPRSALGSRLYSLQASLTSLQLVEPGPDRPCSSPAQSSLVPTRQKTDYEDVLTAGGQPTCLGRGVFGEVIDKKRAKPCGALVAFKNLKATANSTAAYQQMIRDDSDDGRAAPL